jgi:N-acetylglucosaminyl-diphospho-decaprenol L-rhamnosyltransferase
MLMSALPNSPSDLAIVIVNYNTSGLLRDCLRSVYASEGNLDLAVCVVDNASPDDSVAMVRAEFPQAQLIANANNVGYPTANNQGLRVFGFGEPSLECGARASLARSTVAAEAERASSACALHTRLSLPRHALLLNPDTVLPPTALAEMVAFMDARPAVGVAGPKLIRLDGSLDKACRRSFPTPATSLYHLTGLDRIFPHSRRFARYNLTYLDPDEVSRVDAGVGAFMLVRREAILQAGLLDGTFFMYGEDLDWAKRITDCGWEVWYNPRVTVLHVKEAASRHSYKARVEFYRALTIFYNKHYRATTPFYLDWAIRGGVLVFGNADLLARRLRGQYRTSAAAKG